MYCFIGILAGARLGFGAGSEAMIADLNAIKFSTNPYNVNRMTLSAGYTALCEGEHYQKTTATIIENRAYTVTELQKLGFSVLDSKANFVFATHPAIRGKDLYSKLKERGILVRHFDKSRLTEYNRITIGSREQMDALLTAIKDILEE